MEKRGETSDRLVMFYTEKKGKERQIAELCGQLGCRARVLSMEDVNRPVGQTAGIFKNAPGGGRPGDSSGAPVGYRLPELMIFSGFQEEQLDRFLEAYRLAGIEPVGLKAVLTPYNVNWTAYQLAGELIRERTAMMTERRKER